MDWTSFEDGKGLTARGLISGTICSGGVHAILNFHYNPRFFWGAYARLYF